MSEDKVRTEEFKIDGDRLVGKVKELIHKGNIRRVVIKNTEGHALIDIPLTWGVVGSILAPQLAALGAIAALIGRATIVVERYVEDDEEESRGRGVGSGPTPGDQSQQPPGLRGAATRHQCDVFRWRIP